MPRNIVLWGKYFVKIKLNVDGDKPDSRSTIGSDMS
jgi:hypothetical protein